MNCYVFPKAFLSNKLFYLQNKKETENRSSQNSECDPETSVYVESGSTTTSETSINRFVIKTVCFGLRYQLILLDTA